MDEAIVVSTRHLDAPRIAAHFAVLNEAATDVSLNVDLELLAAERTGDQKLLGHSGNLNAMLSVVGLAFIGNPAAGPKLIETSPLVGVYEVRTLDSVYFRELATPIVAAARGLFTVLSLGVSRRRREFGIRTALGSSPGQIRALVLRDGLSVALAGVAIGSVAAWWLARGLASLEYGVTNADPVTWSIVLGVIAVTTMAACWRPARQATHVDPVMLLREE